MGDGEPGWADPAELLDRLAAEAVARFERVGNAARFERVGNAARALVAAGVPEPAR
jgi:hypothetical protein